MTSGMLQVVTENVLGEVVQFYPGFQSRYSWKLKNVTKNCNQCSCCIGKKQAINIVRMVELSGECNNWSPPPPEGIFGICLWGVCPKILCPKIKPGKCQYFGEGD